MSEINFDCLMRRASKFFGNPKAFPTSRIALRRRYRANVATNAACSMPQRSYIREINNALMSRGKSKSISGKE